MSASWSTYDFGMLPATCVGFFWNCLGGCSVLGFKSGTSIVALNNSRADVVGSGLSEGRVGLLLVLGLVLSLALGTRCRCFLLGAAGSVVLVYPC